MSGATVELSFSFPNGETSKISISEPQELNINLIHPSAAQSNLSYEYSGRHDQGVLPALKSEGPTSHMIAAMIEAKQQSDIYLTKLIEEQMKEEKAQTDSGSKVKASEDDIEEDADDAAGRKRKTKKMRKLDS